MIATGTAALIGAGIAAAGTVTAAKMASDANKRAGDIQGKSTQEAIDLQKQTEATRHSEWQSQQDASRAAWTARQAMMAPFLAGGQSVLAKYGITGAAPSMPSSLSAPMPAGWDGTSPPPSAGATSAPTMPVPGPAMASQSPATIGDMISPQAPGGPQTATDWSDWNRYLGGPNA